MFFLYFKSLHVHANLKSICIFLLSFTTFALLSNVSTAQNAAKNNTDSLQSKFEIGIAGGLSLNQFTKDQPQTGLSTGYSAGLLINYKIYTGISIQLEANILQQGGQLISFKDDTRVGLPETFESKNVKNSSIKLNSIEVPLLVNYSFKLKQTWVPSVYAGGSYAYSYNVTEHYQKTGDLLPGEDIIATVTDSQNITSRFNTSRFNLIVGANVKLPLFSNVKLLIDFRYLTGLTPARENYSYMGKIGFGSDIRSNSFISKIGLILPL